MKNQRVLVTGGAGFIGSNPAEELARENEVIIFDDLSTGRMGNIKELLEKDNFRFIRGSITDLEMLQRSFKDIDYVFHQASLASVPRSIQNPIGSNEANITGTLNVLTAARDCGIKKVVYASSSSVYGDTPTCGKRITINQLVEMINEILGKSIEPVFTETRSGDIKHSLADISRARSFGYEPESNFKDGLKETIRWFENAII